jgi:hypothetical protein
MLLKRMNPLPRNQRLLFATAGGLAISTLILATVSVQAQSPRVPFDGQSNHAIRYILEKLDLQPVGSTNEIAGTVEPSQIAIIVFGEPAVLGRLSGGPRSFVERGGRLLLATDRPTTALERDFGITVSGSLLTIDARSALAYRGLSQCPFVVALGGREPSIFGNLARIATNMPSFLEMAENASGQGGALKPLARLQDCRVENTQGIGFLRRLWPEQPRVFAAGGVVGKGRILVLADHSVFINDMMLQPDNDNFDFALGAIRWLTEPASPGGPAPRRVFFVDEGAVVTDFKVPLKDPPGIPLPTADVLNQLLLGIEYDNVFNRLILNRFSLGQVLSGIALGLTGTVVVFGGMRLARSSHGIDPHAPVAVLGTGSALPGAGLIDQRHQTMLAEGKLWEAAREIVRQNLRALGSQEPRVSQPETSQGESGFHGNRPPEIVGGGRSGRRRYLRNLMLRLWALAYAESPRRLSRAEFRRVVIEVDELARAAKEGTLQLNGVKQTDDRKS